jgi:esterase
MLNTIRYGEAGAATPLVVAHGLFGSAKNWGAVARRLAAERPVVAVDMRNHGDSLRSPDHGYPAMADDLAEVVGAAGGRAALLGHSMGGKAAMLLALRQPALVDRLIVADMAPVAYEHTQLPYVRAMQAVDLSRVARRSDADAQLAAAVSEREIRAFLLQSLDLSGDGARWKLNLEVLAEQMPLIMGFPEAAGRYDGPALFLSGARSDYVQDAHWPEIERLFPAARRQEIAGAGHWVHAEAPDAVAEAVEAFLRAP